MKIKHFKLSRRTLPLKKVFRTALREATSLSEVVISITMDNGIVGVGSACASEKITGETLASIESAIEENIAPQLTGMDLQYWERVMEALQGSLKNNCGAKAGVDIALYDALAQSRKLPLWKLLGGYRSQLETNLTLSLDSPEKMYEEAQKAVEEGFLALKIKVGADLRASVQLVEKIRNNLGENIQIRLDANQAWTAQEAITVIEELKPYQIELVEQPVSAHNWEGLKWIRERVQTLIMADESVFSLEDAHRLVSHQAADILNIKLMKCGGIHQALKINHVAEAAGIECMVGSMMEGPISSYAAACLAAAQKNVTRVDLDSVLFLKPTEPLVGFRYEGRHIYLDE